LAIECAWMWVFHQPASALSQWWRQRYADGGKRLRKIGIVALARKLMIALWRYLTQGLIPEGAVVK
jgi:transposase